MQLVTHTQPFYGSLDLVRDNPGEPEPEKNNLYTYLITTYPCETLCCYHITTTLFSGLFSRTTWVSRHQRGKPLWILMKQEMIGGNGISWTICKSFAPRSRQMILPVPHHSVFNFVQAGCPSCRPTNSVTALKTMLYVIIT